MKVLLILVVVTAVFANNTYYYNRCRECNSQACVVNFADNGTDDMFYELKCVCDSVHCGSSCDNKWVSKSDFVSCINTGVCNWNRGEGVAANVFFVMIIAIGSVILITVCILLSVDYYKKWSDTDAQRILLNEDPELNDDDEIQIVPPKKCILLDVKLELFMLSVVLIVFIIIFVVTFVIHKNKIVDSSDDRFCL